MEDKRIVLLTLTDGEFSATFVVKTHLNEAQLQMAVEEIKKDFENEGFIDWSYEDILEALQRLKLIKPLPYEEVTVTA
jgi:hypothetical protein